MLIQNTKEHLRPLFEQRGFSDGKVWGFTRLDLIVLLAIQTWENSMKLG